MAQLFKKYCIQTMSEIYEAALVPVPKGRPAPGGPVDAEKLRAKALQFFPNIQLSVDEINNTPQVSISSLFESEQFIFVVVYSTSYFVYFALFIAFAFQIDSCK
jgi:hypothetical protein